MINKFYSSLLNLPGHFRNDETLFEASLLASDQLMAHPSNELLGKSPRLVNSSDLELEFWVTIAKKIKFYCDIVFQQQNQKAEETGSEQKEVSPAFTFVRRYSDKKKIRVFYLSRGIDKPNGCSISWRGKWQTKRSNALQGNGKHIANRNIRNFVSSTKNYIIQFWSYYEYVW